MKRLTITVRIKEPFSALSHLLGAFLAAAGLALLVTFAALEASVWHVVAFAIFGGAALLTYVASTFYHWLPLRVSQEKRFRSIDMSMIFLMIAGTYTPICLVPIQGWWGYTMLVLIWLLAIFGIAQCWMKQYRGRHRQWATRVYLGMGWLSLAIAPPLVRALSAEALFWLVAGGVAYTLGAIVYGLGRPNPLPRVIGSHEIFHVFVLLGSFCHFWLMFAYVMKIPAVS